jgi:hypothetical protein
MRSSRTTRWLTGIGSLLVLAAAFAFWPFRFYYDSVCSQCGAIQSTTEWQLPLNHHCFFRRSTVEATALSSYLTSSGVVGTHQHQWLFGHGGGNGVQCALGDGDNIRATVTSPEVVHLLAYSRQFGEQEESSNLLRFAFDRDISRAILSLATHAPTNGFVSREAYRVWITDQRWFIDQALEIAKQNR